MMNLTGRRFTKPFGVLGLSLLALGFGTVLAQAVRPSMVVEAELGNPSGQVSMINDSSASGGGYAMFNAAPTPAPTPTPTPTPTPPPSSGTSFSEDFSSISSLERFDWQVFHGGVDPFPRNDQPRSWFGDHDMACGAPTTLRTVQLVGEVGPGSVSNAGNVVWWCAPGNESTKGHVMTSLSIVAYGHVDFSPRQVFNNISRVCFDANRTEMGGRKWLQVTVVPESVFQANGRRLDYVNPALQGDVAVNGEFLEDGAFQLFTFRSATRFASGGPNPATSSDDRNVETLDAFASGNDKATRFRHCLTESPSGIVLTIHSPTGEEMTRTNVEGNFHFPTGQSRVIFQDVTYDSIKGDFSFDEAQRTNTWHWDNISIQ